MIGLNLGFVRMQDMTEQDIITSGLMVLRTMTIVLNLSTIPFVVYDEHSFTHYFEKAQYDKKNHNNRRRNTKQQQSFDNNDDDDDHNQTTNEKYMHAKASLKEKEQKQRQRQKQRTQLPKPNLRRYDDRAECDDDDCLSDIDNDITDDVVDASIKDKEETNYMATLTLHNVSVVPCFSSRNDWWEVRGIYKVMRYPFRGEERARKRRRRQLGQHQESSTPSSMVPVYNRNILRKIAWACDQAIDTAIATGMFWSTLQSIEFGDQSLILSKPYYLDDKGLIDCTDTNGQYDLSLWECPTKRPKHNNTTSSTTFTKTDSSYGNRMCATPDDNNERVKWNSTTITSNTGVDHHAGGTNQEENEIVMMCRKPIAETFSDIVWSTREWVGLGLLVTTILFVATSSTIAHYILERRRRQRLWGAALTRDGVDDLLQVGWRYHEQQPATDENNNNNTVGDKIGNTTYNGNSNNNPKLKSNKDGKEYNDDNNNNINPQLFLQIFDKGTKGPGYNDENSLLRGGVERIHDGFGAATDLINSTGQPTISTTAPTTSIATPPPVDSDDSLNKNSNNISTLHKEEIEQQQQQHVPLEPFRPQYPD